MPRNSPRGTKTACAGPTIPTAAASYARSSRWRAPSPASTRPSPGARASSRRAAPACRVSRSIPATPRAGSRSTRWPIGPSPNSTPISPTTRSPATRSRPTAIPRSAARHAPARCAPAKTPAPAAGAAGKRSNAASISPPNPGKNRRSSSIALHSKIAESRDLRLEFQRHLAGRAVALLGDDQFGEAIDALHVARPFGVILEDLGIVALNRTLRLLGGGIIILTIDEPHHIRVLFDRARFAQVGKLRPLVLALLDRTAELRQCQNRHVKILR